MSKQWSAPLTIQVVDMSEEDLDFAYKLLKDAFETEKEERRIAWKVKCEFDKLKGKWSSSNFNRRVMELRCWQKLRLPCDPPNHEVLVLLLRQREEP